MYGLRINFNDGKADPLQFICYESDVTCGGPGYYLTPGPLELDLFGQIEPAIFMANVLFSFLLDEMTDNITNPDTDQEYRREDWLEVLVSIEQRCIVHGVEPGMFIFAKDRHPYFKHLSIDVVLLQPELQTVILPPLPKDAKKC